MRIITDKKNMTYSIVGVPKSGTTILSKIMDNIDGSICISEPIRNMHSLNLRMKTKIDINQTDRFLDNYFKYIKNNSPNKIGGVKETYSNLPSRVNREVNKIFDKSEFLIFHLREPKDVFNGWKQLKWDNGLLRPRFRFNVKMFCKIYKDYVERYHTSKMIKPTFLIRYEDVMENFSDEWLNNIFKGYIRFDGNLDIKDLGIMDSKSKYTYTLTKDEVKLIDEELLPLYKNLRGYGYY